MTGLGAAIYFGLFAVAAVWLFVTSDRFRSRGTWPDQSQVPDRSNSTSTFDDSEGSNPWLVSHSASK